MYRIIRACPASLRPAPQAVKLRFHSLDIGERMRLSAQIEPGHFRELFLRERPLLDTRSPGEFAKGAFPKARNLPLMTDAEREQIGICYARKGQAAAIELGHRLVAGDERERRVRGWREFARRHPDGCLYCWRGGLRSEIAQQWLRDAGVDYPRVAGGYKALRRFLIRELERACAAANVLLVGGKTGAGKTRVIQAAARGIDLEALANHRGSSFGRMIEPQPAQIDFENALAIQFLQLLEGGGAAVLLEDEGSAIGSIGIPLELRRVMQGAPLAVVEESLAARAEVIFEDYVLELGARYRQAHGAEGAALHRRHLEDGLGRIRKRLGGELHDEIAGEMKAAFDAGARELHRRWIRALLERYYDPMYEYQMSRKAGEVLFRGSRREVIAFAGEWAARH